jgi:hypothetical protein
MWKLNTDYSDNCPCVSVKMFDACKLIYEPVLHGEDQVDVTGDCSNHLIEAEIGKESLWTPNAHYYGTRALHNQQRQWIKWRVKSRVRYEVEYAKQRRDGVSAEDARARVIPADLHPALEEQVPPARMEREYDQQLRGYVTTGTEAPWDRSLPEGPDVEPVMPEQIPPPTNHARQERALHWGWIRTEALIKSSLHSLADAEAVDRKAVKIQWEGKRERLALITTDLNLEQRDRIRSALLIQFGQDRVTLE